MGNKPDVRVTVAGMLALCAACLGDPPVSGSPQRYAVAIGINDYADPAIPDLKYAESDAKAVYDTLTNQAVGRTNCLAEADKFPSHAEYLHPERKARS